MVGCEVGLGDRVAVKDALLGVMMSRRGVYPRSRHVARFSEGPHTAGGAERLGKHWIKALGSLRLHTLEFDGDAFHRGACKTVDIVDGNKAIETARDRDIDKRIASF